MSRIGDAREPWPSACRWTDTRQALSSAAMETGAAIVTFWPRWTDSAGTMLRLNALVRTRCSVCGTLVREDLADIVARHGSGCSLIDRLERCRMIGCAGSTFYVASRTYGGEWITLLRDPLLIATFADSPPVRTATG